MKYRFERSMLVAEASAGAEVGGGGGGGGGRENAGRAAWQRSGGGGQRLGGASGGDYLKLNPGVKCKTGGQPSQAISIGWASDKL